ncbi:MAG: alcohol dehydrogenase catalytic domain-containing protein [Deltaproteobacteria bacterium]
MKALIFDGQLHLEDRPVPERLPGQALIRVSLAGICNTDHEIVRGYGAGFNGILGHEFVGRVAEADDFFLIGRRATAEINCACGVCSVCRKGLGRHCPHRSVLGIVNRDGAMAEYVVVPEENLVLLPDSLPDREAVFLEPLAAACAILEQVNITADNRVLLLGDGKLAILVAFVLLSSGCRLTVVGKHQEKLDLLAGRSLSLRLLDQFQPDAYDIVVEATGKAEGFALAMDCVRPRGTMVVKSTYAGNLPWNPTALVVNELTIIGSRCGRFEDALVFLEREDLPLARMISVVFPLAQALEAFRASELSETLKILLDCS